MQDLLSLYFIHPPHYYVFCYLFVGSPIILVEVYNAQDVSRT